MATITTQQLLDAAKAAYLNALQAASVTNGPRSITQQQIDKLAAEVQRLEAKLAAEQLAARGQTGPSFALADFSKALP
ncbi:MAG TPA: hypothetical protein VFS13_00565 [Steroidobacteraceae bacterium]|nr:hypothetical protein [Steroidobacteraceae bacterium]